MHAKGFDGFDHFATRRNTVQTLPMRRWVHISRRRHHAAARAVCVADRSACIIQRSAELNLYATDEFGVAVRVGNRN